MLAEKKYPANFSDDDLSISMYKKIVENPIFIYLMLVSAHHMKAQEKREKHTPEYAHALLSVTKELLCPRRA